MPNPFEQHITPDPESVRLAEWEKNQKEAAAKLMAREVKHREAFSQNDPMVSKVLNDLIPAVYPSLILERRKAPITDGSNSHERYSGVNFDWAVGSWAYSQIKNNSRSGFEYLNLFNEKVGVNIVTKDDDSVKIDIFLYVSEETRQYPEEISTKWHGVIRSLEAEPTEQSLVQKLIELHEANPRAAELLSHADAIESALKRHARGSVRMPEVIDRMRRHPQQDLELIRREEEFVLSGEWSESYRYHGDEFSPGLHINVYSSVNIIFNNEKAIIGYEFSVNEQTDLVRCEPNEEALYNALLQADASVKKRTDMEADQKRAEKELQERKNTPKQRWLDRLCSKLGIEL